MGKFRFLFIFMVLAWSFTAAQQPVVDLPAPDAEGWIKLFRGDNTDDWYTFYSGNIPSEEAGTFPDGTFDHDGDVITVTGSPTGHLIFRQSFSHYRISYQLRFPGNLGNCGMLIHIQEDDPAMWNTFPRSLEAQGDPNQGMGQLWCIGHAWVTVPVVPNSSPPRYDPTGETITYGAENDNMRVVTGIHGWGQPRPSQLDNGGWITIEAEAHGRDSVMHYVEGELMMQYFEPRIAPPNDRDNIEKYLEGGLIGWQSEGTGVEYQNIKVKLFPDDPLYAQLYVREGCMDPTALNYDTLATDSCLDCCEYACCNDNTFVEYTEDCSAERHREAECITLGISEKLVAGHISISSDAVSINANAFHSIEITNVSGEIVFSQTGSRAAVYDLNHLQTGIYIVKVTAPGIRKNRKILRF
jgi:hypothetical protein